MLDSVCPEMTMMTWRKANFKSDFEIFSNITDERCDNELKQRGIMDELEWRLVKVKLEEANERAFLKRIRSKPWKLPYEEARKWVKGNLGAKTKDEFFDLVANGNLRTPYIPKEPEKYYSEKGTWFGLRREPYQQTRTFLVAVMYSLGLLYCKKN